MSSPGVAGILRVAWKILRGAEVASTEMVTVGAVAHQLEIDQIANETTPKSLANFMEGLPCAREKSALIYLCGRYL